MLLTGFVLLALSLLSSATRTTCVGTDCLEWAGSFHINPRLRKGATSLPPDDTVGDAFSTEVSSSQLTPTFMSRYQRKTNQDNRIRTHLAELDCKELWQEETLLSGLCVLVTIPISTGAREDCRLTTMGKRKGSD